MSDNVGEDKIPKGNDWEVVALTESIYAAAPSPNQDNADATNGGFMRNSKSETSDALFLSSHFGVASSTHENLSLDPEEKSKPDELGSEPNVYEEECGVKLGLKNEEDLSIEGLMSDEFHDSPKSNETSNIMPVYSSGFRDAASSNFNIYGETAASISSVLSEDSLFESPEHPLNSATSSTLKHIESEKINEFSSNLPSESWWRRHAFPFYELVKTAYPLWYVATAATFLSLVIIGNRWSHDKPEVLHLTSQFLTNDEGSGWVLYPTAKLKEINWNSNHCPRIKFATLDGKVR